MNDDVLLALFFRADYGCPAKFLTARWAPFEQAVDREGRLDGEKLQREMRQLDATEVVTFAARITRRSEPCPTCDDTGKVLPGPFYPGRILTPRPCPSCGPKPEKP